MTRATRHNSKCTGSLIASAWFLTAAHCTELIPRTGREQKNRECLERTRQGKTFDATDQRKGFVRHLKCRKVQQNGEDDSENLHHLVFYDIEPKPVAWIGVDDVNDVESWKDSGAMRTIAEIVRHALSYKGGGYYGDYGGYDISLVKLDKPVSGSAPACLPGPIFKDAGVVAGLAGHGEYHREGGRTCQTDGHGQYKHKYCKTQGEGRQVCNLNSNGKSKPAPRSKECRRFFKHKDTPKDIPRGKEDILILKGTSNVRAMYGDKITYCYRRFSPADRGKKHGWCRIQGGFYNAHTVDHAPKGWGFCSNNCFF